MHPASVEKFIISESASIRDAMRAINNNFCEVAFVRNAEGRIVGAITDGDIRRGLLKGLPLEAKALEIMNRNFASVNPDCGRAEALDLMKARTIRQLPMLDAGGRLVGVHLLRELIGTVERPNVAMIMAGGRGTRLGTLTESVPKPMIRVAGRPILERIILHLVGEGIHNIYLSVNYLANVIQDHFGEGERFGCRLVYLQENRPLGTAGALALLPEQEWPFLVMNGDLVTKFSVDDLLRFHQQGDYTATVCSRLHSVDIPYGVLEHEGSAFKGIKEKPSFNYPINAGIYILSPEVRDQFRRAEPLDMPKVISDLHAQGDRIGVFPIDDDWVDVGRREDLKRATGIYAEG